MTLSIVVACKDSFYLISDTRTVDVSANTYSENTKKVFYSLKHKMGLCIADGAFLSDPSDPTNKEKSLSVSYLLEEFFNELDKIDPVAVMAKIKSAEDLFNRVLTFIKFKYGQVYADVFTATVSVFLGCLIDGKSAIGSWFKQEWRQFEYSDASLKTQACYFSNYEKTVDSYLGFLVTGKDCNISGSNQIEKQNKLLRRDQYRGMVFSYVIPFAREFILKEHPASVGECFEYVAINADGKSNSLKFRVGVLYEGDVTKPFYISLAEVLFPKYIIVKTMKEHDDVVRDGKIVSHSYAKKADEVIEKKSKSEVTFDFSAMAAAVDLTTKKSTAEAMVLLGAASGSERPQHLGYGEKINKAAGKKIDEKKKKPTVTLFPDEIAMAANPMFRGAPVPKHSASLSASSPVHSLSAAAGSPPAALIPKVAPGISVVQKSKTPRKTRS